MQVPLSHLERLSGKGMLVAERVGAGSVILFVDTVMQITLSRKKNLIS